MILQEPINPKYLAPEFHCPEKYLSWMFNRQATVIQKLKEIENFPDYPLDINDRGNQVLVKDLLYRTIEELSEAYAERLSLLQSLSANNPEGVEEKVVKYNEEIVDALHFIIELCLFINIDDQAIFQYFSQPDMIIQGEQHGVSDLHSLFNLLKLRLSHQQLTTHSIEDFCANYQKPLYTEAKGGRYISNTRVENEEKLLWIITHTLTITGNTLRSRPWKRNDTITNDLELQEGLLLAIKGFFIYLVYMNFNAHSLALLFHLKNDINLQRFNNE